jgi:hypothetical protein
VDEEAEVEADEAEADAQLHQVEPAADLEVIPEARAHHDPSAEVDTTEVALRLPTAPEAGHLAD